MSLSLLVGTTVYYAYLIIAGNRGDYELGPGPKVVLVASGGTLELHGKRKLSWTKLDKTAEKTENTDNLLYDHLVSKSIINHCPAEEIGQSQEILALIAYVILLTLCLLLSSADNL